MATKGSLQDAHIDDAALEARWIIEAVTGLTRAEQILTEDRPANSQEVADIKTMVKRRLKGEPLDFIFGYKAFYGRRFEVNQHVLSPRPETEMLVDFVLDKTKYDDAFTVLDLGTGSGAIVISVLAERPKAQAIAVDISEDALTIARINAETHGVVDRLLFLEGDWSAARGRAFDYVLSNPPYIDRHAMKALSHEVLNFDPEVALYGGEDGLEAYRAILKQAPFMMNEDSWLAVEIGYDQGALVSEIVRKAGLKQVTVLKDLSAHDRIVYGRAAKSPTG